MYFPICKILLKISLYSSSSHVWDRNEYYFFLRLNFTRHFIHRSCVDMMLNKNGSSRTSQMSIHKSCSVKPQDAVLNIYLFVIFLVYALVVYILLLTAMIFMENISGAALRKGHVCPVLWIIYNMNFIVWTLGRCMSYGAPIICCIYWQNMNMYETLVHLWVNKPTY